MALNECEKCYTRIAFRSIKQITLNRLCIVLTINCMHMFIWVWVFLFICILLLVYMYVSWCACFVHVCLCVGGHQKGKGVRDRFRGEVNQYRIVLYIVCYIYIYILF